MSVPEATAKQKPGPETHGRPHAIYLAVSFTDTTNGARVDLSHHLARQTTRAGDIEQATTRLAAAVAHVLAHADEGCDASITLALLHKVQS